MSKTINQVNNLEVNLKELESIVASLQREDISIDEGIALYEKSTRIAKICLEQINIAQGKITELKKEMEKLID